jgi:iron complex transport system ATP-binding protein
LISLQNIGVSYGNRDILCDVSVRFFKGLSYLVGLNGSGKTSLLHAMAGLQAHSGSISWEGKNLEALSARARARQIALVHQHINLPFQLRLYDFVLMGRFPYLNWLGDYQPSDHQAAEAAIQKMELEPFRQRHMNEISGGEFQRACLARAICQDTPILLLDEPAQSLDPRAQRHLYRMLRSLAQAGRWVICATHDLAPLQDQQARVIGLAQGKIVWDQPGGAPVQDLQEKVYLM